MMRALRFALAGLLVPVVCAVSLAAEAQKADEPAPAQGPAKYTLRYRFNPGETLRWEVVHRAKIETSVSGTTQTAETLSTSVKVWRVRKVEPNGNATFEHSVESVQMRQKLSGRQEIQYNSQTDSNPPPGFENVADSIGKTLSVVTMDPTGKILDRQRKPAKASAESDGQMTIPLPSEPVAVGATWSFHYEANIPLETGGVKPIKTLQKFTLENVQTGVALIRVETQILTPIDDPAIEALLIQRQSNGTVRFDVDAGRVLSQQMDLDRRVVGFRGPASSLHCLTRFTEKLLAAEPRTAAKAGPGPKETKK